MDDLFNKLREAGEEHEIVTLITPGGNPEGVKVTHPRTIACDLDGVLAEYDGWKGADVIGKPIESVVNDLKAEKEKGTKIIIHTTRTNSAVNVGFTTSKLVEIVANWLLKNNIPYDEIWQGTGKPIADEYWDDRAVVKP